MKVLQVMIFAALIVSFAACSGASSQDSRTPAGESSGSIAEADQGGGDPDAPPSVPCETSDDCAQSQICVDDECAIPAPAGFY